MRGLRSHVERCTLMAAISRAQRAGISLWERGSTREVSVAKAAGAAGTGMSMCEEQWGSQPSLV